MVPYTHAELSAKRFGGTPEDYIDIHELMDSSKAAYSNNAHRILTHNSWFTTTIIPKIFGHQRTNSDGKKYSTKDVCEFHVLEDFRMQFIPTVQDYLEDMGIPDWVNNGKGIPSRLRREKAEAQEVKEETPAPVAEKESQGQKLRLDGRFVLDGRPRPDFSKKTGFENLGPSSKSLD